MLDGQTTPIAVPGVTDLAGITVGWGHSCGLAASGGVQCWGTYNAWGQIGDGTMVDTIPSPVDVVGLTDAVRIDGGSYHSCVIDASAQVRCWGNNQGGQVGAGSIDGSPMPVLAEGVGEVTDIAAGGFHTCALLSAGGASTGEVSCWGGIEGAYDGMAKVEGVSTATDVSAGAGEHACAIDSDGRVLCWGDNSAGQLGDGSTEGTAMRAVQTAL